MQKFEWNVINSLDLTSSHYHLLPKHISDDDEVKVYVQTFLNSMVARTAITRAYKNYITETTKIHQTK
ncbi:hypothetical protein C0J52_00234 [Blattella germanica]|nr:hypothetical protein C0J52_00234 [Blattella germanica]